MPHPSHHYTLDTDASLRQAIGQVGQVRYDGWAEELLAEGFTLLPIKPSQATAYRRLPIVEIDSKPHRDPFDRMLSAQALAEGVAVVTRDPAIAAHGVPIVW